MAKKIVVIGGGTGSYNLLRGLKKYVSDDKNMIEISAIVTMMDSGGSSGTLRDEYGILPPGDIRRCLIALSEETEIMKKLFQYRFDAGVSNGKTSLEGHNFGNLFLTALRNILGSEEQAILEAHNILQVRGRVIPVTLDNVHLCAELENGEIIKGEKAIDLPRSNSEVRIQKVYLEPPARAYRSAIEAIEQADVILIGPGDLFTSIIANLVVKGIAEAIKSSRALKIYNCNIMTKYGETNNFSVFDHFRTIEHYLGKNVIDIVTYNTKHAGDAVLEKYKQEHAEEVRFVQEEFNDHDEKKPMTVGGDLIAEPTVIRHDPDKIAGLIMKLISNGNGH